MFSVESKIIYVRDAHELHVDHDYLGRSGL